MNVPRKTATTTGPRHHVRLENRWSSGPAVLGEVQRRWIGEPGVLVVFAVVADHVPGLGGDEDPRVDAEVLGVDVHPRVPPAFAAVDEVLLRSVVHGRACLVPGRATGPS
jgi:hypothetical protein